MGRSAETCESSVYVETLLKDGADVTFSGRLFRTLGSTEANERSPTVTSRDRRMSSRLEDADLNRLRDGMSAAGCS